MDTKRRYWFLAVFFLIIAGSSRTTAQSLVPPESWIRSLIEESSVIRGQANFIYSLPLTPRVMTESINRLLANDSDHPNLSLQHRNTLLYAKRLRGLNPQLVRRPMIGLFNARTPLDVSNKWLLNFGGFVSFETIQRSAEDNPYLTRYDDRRPALSNDATASYDTIFYARIHSVVRTLWPIYESEQHDNNWPRRVFQDLDLRNFHKAYIYLDFRWVDILAGRDNLHWGVGERSSLLLSSNVPYFDMIRLSAGTRFWRLTTVFAGLNDYEPQFHSPGMITPVKDLFKPPRHLFAHRLDIIPWDRLNIGITELTVIFGRYPNLGDLNPLIIGHNLFREYQNSLAGMDITYYPIPGLCLYGEAAFDEIAFGMGSEDLKRPTSYAFQIGMRSAFAGLILTSEYTFIDKWFYNYPKEYDPYGRPLELDGVSYSATPGRDIRIIPLGHWLPPDTRSWMAGIRSSFALPYLLRLAYERREHGEVELTTEYLDTLYAGKSTPTGTVEKKDIVTAEVGYGIWNFFGRLRVYWFDTSNDSHVAGARRKGLEFSAAISYYY